MLHGWAGKARKGWCGQGAVLDLAVKLDLRDHQAIWAKVPRNAAMMATYVRVMIDATFVCR